MAVSYSLYDSVQLQLQFVFKVATINTCILAFYNHFIILILQADHRILLTFAKLPESYLDNVRKMIFNSDTMGYSSIDLYVSITFFAHGVYRVFLSKQAQHLISFAQ